MRRPGVGARCCGADAGANTLGDMLTPREIARRLQRRPRAVVAITAASALVLCVGVAGYSAMAEAESREAFAAEIDEVSASIVRSSDTGRAVVTAHVAAAVCVAAASDRLAPVVSAPDRLAGSSFERASIVVRTAPEVVPAPVYDPAPPTAPPADGGVSELQATLAELRRAEVEAEAQVAGLASTARRTEQQCDTARAALASIVDEIGHRTDELIAANPKAAGEAVAALTAARASVMAAEADALARWLAAASALESSHSAAVLSEQQAAEAEAEAEAARRTATQEDVDATDSRGGLYRPGESTPPRELSNEEFCQLVPSACVNGAPAPLPLDG